MISIDTPKMALSMAPTVKLVCSAMLANKKNRNPITNVRRCNVLKRNETKSKQNQTKTNEKKK